MKSLISVTPREFNHHFCEVMDKYTDVCMTTNQEISIVIPEKKNGQTYVEIAKITPVGEGKGVKYGYNYEILKKFGINTDNRMNKIESIIADAFEKSGMTEYARNNKTAVGKLQNAIMITAKELVKQLGL